MNNKTNREKGITGSIVATVLNSGGPLQIHTSEEDVSFVAQAKCLRSKRGAFQGLEPKVKRALGLGSRTQEGWGSSNLQAGTRNNIV